MYRVTINFQQKEIDPVIIENARPGQSLLEFVLANNIELNHECGGICTCTTCHIYVEKGAKHIEEMYKRERDFLKKVNNANSNSRLGCQSLLMKGNGEIEIIIPVQQIKESLID